MNVHVVFVSKTPISKKEENNEHNYLSVVKCACLTVREHYTGELTSCKVNMEDKNLPCHFQGEMGIQVSHQIKSQTYISYADFWFQLHEKLLISNSVLLILALCFLKCSFATFFSYHTCTSTKWTISTLIRTKCYDCLACQVHMYNKSHTARHLPN